MRLGAEGGHVLDLSVVGYQFPDADDARLRYSWHMIQGRAGTGSETWDFRWQALTCDESRYLAAWLREVADASAFGRATPVKGPGPTCFTEPDLAFEVESYLHGAVFIRAELDLEFRAPSNKPNHFVVSGQTVTEAVLSNRSSELCARPARGESTPTLRRARPNQ